MDWHELQERGYNFWNQKEPVEEKRDLGPGISGSSGNYYGGYWRSTGDGSDGSGWRYGLSASGSTPVLDHTILRQNARSAYHDSMQGRAIIERYADLIPGVGLRLEATPDADTLGMTPEEAEAWAQKAEHAFDAFMRSKDFSLAEDMTGYQTQRFVTIQQQRDGEYFAQLSYIQRDGLNPLQVSFLDPSQIQGYPLTDTAGYHFSEYGINRDSKGREVSYNVRVYNPENNSFDQRVIRRVGQRSKRVLVLHGFQKEYAVQTRGYSRIGHILQQLENLTDFEFAHIKKAINESMVALWIKPSKDNPASDGGFTDGISGPAGVFQTADNPQTEAEAAAMPYLDYSELNEINGRPGSWLNMGLREGEELRTIDNKSPSDNYNVFVDAFVKSLASSVSLPSEVVWMQFGESYSASRAALMLAWQVIEIWRNELAADYLNPIYEAWLSGEIAAGRISAPGWTDKRLRSAWLRNNWIGFPMPTIDPSRTAKAHETYVNMGATTLDRVSRELNGSAGKANRAKLVREFEELPPSPFMKGAAPGTPADAENPKKNPKDEK
jgi:capsid protein